ncbi:SRPBCC family protein [Amycolatopsis sp. NPDC059027]|uniref:SRPBCC family protein n=1 Tax=unclassified Amycolatopsis TaxID=2618356 RepID=UPI00366E6CF0
MGQSVDVVTGARTDVSLVVDLPVERLWELVTDVPRYGEWSPECEHTEWLYGAGKPPRVGNRFVGRNRFGGGFVASVICEVTESTPAETFAWVVLDEALKSASIWRYELAAIDAERTRLRHSFEHGPGETMIRVMAEQDPAVVDRRLVDLKRNIAKSLAAMLDGVRYREEAR